MGLLWLTSRRCRQEGKEVPRQDQDIGAIEGMHERVKLVMGPFVSTYEMELIGIDGIRVKGTHTDKKKLRAMLMKKYKAST